MELTRAIAISLIAASLGLGAAVQAQSLKSVGTPSEFPPASYKGKQYVDSKGCVYVRAGVDGNVTWVPRMTRDRKVICGYKPSIPDAKPTTASASKLDKNVVFIAPAETPKSTPTIIPPATKPPKTKTTTTAAATKPKSVTETSASAASKTVTPAPEAKPKTNSFWTWPTTTKKTTTVTKPPETKTTTTTAAPPPAPKPTTTTTTAATKPRRTLNQTQRQSGFDAPCRAGVQTSSRYKVRCGPQTELPYTPGTGNPTAPAPTINIDRSGATLIAPTVGAVVKEGQVASNVRVVPKHVYKNRRLALNETPVPPGYRRVFDDGRLNPKRAEQDFAGKAAMDAIWQETVPRKLRTDLGTGQAVVSSQSSSNATVTSSPVISSSNATAEKSIRLAGQQFVQVATYTDAAKAQEVAKHMRRLGMPAKIGKYTRDGETYRIVLTGPYASTGDADKAAYRARRAGYSGAYVRN